MKVRYIVFGLFSFVLMTAILPSALADAPIEGRAGRAEVRFLEGMMDHHQMALDMAQDCLVKAKTDTVLKTCQDIITAQTAEITTMEGYLLKWYNIEYKPMPMADMMSMSNTGAMNGMHMSVTPTPSGMEGMNMPATDQSMMMGMMAGFNRLEGKDYEVAWLESMIDHHDDAIHMSERLLKRDPQGHPELLKLVQDIITNQTSEIDAMEKMLAG